MTRVSQLACVTCGVLLLGGCRSWETVTISPREAIEAERPSAVRLTDEGGNKLTIRNPTVRNDSVVTADASPFGGPTPFSGLHQDQVAQFEIARFDPVKSAGAAAIIIGTSVLWTRVSGSGSGGNPEPPDNPTKLISIDIWGALGALLGR